MKTVTHVSSDFAYANFSEQVNHQIVQAKNNVFTTNATDLFYIFLKNLPSDQQHYNCKTCKKFIENYGGLVTLDKHGLVKPTVWPVNIDGFFAKSVRKLTEEIRNSQVTGVFYNTSSIWGTPKTGEWSHLSGHTSMSVYFEEEANKLRAERKQDYILLMRSFVDYKLEVIQQAIRVLEADVLDRSGKNLEMAKWFLEAYKNKGSRDIVWYTVLNAPAGWAHIKNTVIGTLLDDIKGGYDFESISKRWNRKMHPLQYQRPTAPPSDNQIEVAEKLVEKLGITASLSRVFAKMEDVKAWLWRPTEMAPKLEVKVFDKLKTKSDNVKPLKLPATIMTWSLFKERWLAKATKIEYKVASIGNYYGLVTAADKNSPPVLKWDFPENRNPVSWFMFNGGSHCKMWNLMPETWVEVKGVFEKPCFWDREFKGEEPGAFLVVQGAKRVETHKGGGLFPEILKAELHEIKRVIEAHSQTTIISGHLESDANGVLIVKNMNYSVNPKITLEDYSTMDFTIDRWE